MKTAARWRTFLVCILVEVLFVFVSTAYSDKGFLNFSIWNRSFLYRNQSYGAANAYETIFHLDFSQDITNYGTITAWTDGLLSKGSGRFARGIVSWSGFKAGTFSFGLNMGDSLFQNTNLDSRFVNLYHPYIYFRGGAVGLISKAFDLTFYGGKLARLAGLLGSTYDVKNQPFYGLKARLKFGKALILGGGILRTENEKDEAGFLAAKKNDVLLADSEITFVRGVKLLGEFQRSVVEEPSTRTTSGNNYAFGPVIKTGRWDFEANYRFAGSRFRNLTPESQIFRDDKGIFSSLRFGISSSLMLFGIAERSSDNVDRDPSRNINNTFFLTSGFSLNSPSLIDLTAQWEYGRKKSEKKLPDSSDYVSNGFFIMASKTLGRFFPYVRFRWQKSEDKENSWMNGTRPTLYVGFRQGLSNKSYIWLEGELNQRFDASHHEFDRDVHARAGMSYVFSSKFDLYTELFYHRFGLRSVFEQLEAFLGLRINLFRDTSLRLDLRALEPLNQKNRSSDYQITLRFSQRFSWGAPPRVLGRGGFAYGTIGVGTVEGYVFEDRNGNGLMDAGDKGLAGIPLRLEDRSTVVTNAEGKYRFSNVAEGPHQVQIEERNIPATLYILSPTQVNVVVEPRVTRQIPFLMISSASLSGRFIEDVNRNGKIDKDDKGLADILVVLTPLKKEGAERTAKAMQEMILNTYTNAEGAFLFDNILPGEYELSVDEETLPKGVKIVVPMPVKIKLEPEGKIEGMNFMVNPRPVIIRKLELIQNSI